MTSEIELRVNPLEITGSGFEYDIENKACRALGAIGIIVGSVC